MADDVPGEFRGIERDFQAWRASRAACLMDDYGELSRYRGANARLGPPAPDEDRVVFFGDSITEGWDLECYFPGKPYINRGIGGQTTPQMLVRFRQDAVALKPHAIVILAGVNDIGGNTGPMRIEDIAANLASMAEIARANGIAVIFSSLLPPPHEATPASQYSLLKHPPAQILALNGWLREYSAAYGCGFVDYCTAMSGSDGLLKPDFSEDGLHPTPAAYRIMTQLAQPVISRVLEAAGTRASA